MSCRVLKLSSRVGSHWSNGVAFRSPLPMPQRARRLQPDAARGRFVRLRPSARGSGLPPLSPSVSASAVARRPPPPEREAFAEPERQGVRLRVRRAPPHPPSASACALRRAARPSPSRPGAFSPSSPGLRPSRKKIRQGLRRARGARVRRRFRPERQGVRLRRAARRPPPPSPRLSLPKPSASAVGERFRPSLFRRR